MQFILAENLRHAMRTCQAPSKIEQMRASNRTIKFMPPCTAKMDIELLRSDHLKMTILGGASRHVRKQAAAVEAGFTQLVIKRASSLFIQSSYVYLHRRKK